MPPRTLWLAAVAALGLSGCDGGGPAAAGDAGTTSPLPPLPERNERGDAIVPLGPLGEVPVPRDNRLSDEKVALGRLLFFDPRTSGDVSTSCASCHNPELGWGDGGDLSRGYPGTQHWRNSQTIFNTGYLYKLFWAGESTSLESQADSAITGNLAGNGDPEMIEERLYQVPEYRRRFREAFGTHKPIYGDVLRAIASFERAEVNSRDVPFDRFAGGDESALTEEAKRGLALFIGKARCLQCHHGPLFTDQDMHALGVPDNPAFDEDPQRQIALRFQHYSRGLPEEEYRDARTDLGLYYTTRRPEDRGRFRTAPLRELHHTGPYMHNGVFLTLAEVVDFYDRGGGEGPNKSELLRALGLSDREKGDLIAFLESLSGDRVLIEPPDLPAYEVIQ